MTRAGERILVLGVSVRRSDLFEPSSDQLQSRMGNDAGRRILGSVRDRGEGAVALPDGPDDPGELVGESGGGLVVAECGLACESPGTEAIRGLALGGVKHGASAVDEQGSQVDVSALGDSAEASSQAGGVLSGSQAEVAGEVTR